MELNIRNVSLTFGQKLILDNINLNLHSGGLIGLIGLIGPNGAGKSTLLRTISTILKPEKGNIFLDGVDIVKYPKKMRISLGYLPQQVPYYPHLTPIEYLQYIAAIKGISKKQARSNIENLLTKFHLINAGNTKLADFSGGMRQRVGIAATLLGDPKVIIVDEPIVGLDPLERVTIRNVLAEMAVNHIVILSTHIISDIEAVASKIIVLKEGQILYTGSPEGLLQRVTNSVWEYTAPVNQVLNQLENVSSIAQEIDGIHIRVISQSKPNAEAVNVTPRLEDASLAILESGD
ncbi:ATP-binding cassette domain-containing protein [Lactobacillus bombicola]|uniref:ATP-binding cassette domain-containing protein n=1 Tax=Lactobacillus bombicola TaxID=1505723 RepID=UPI000E586177|nr:ATP-binding cassette domain-containing protein [Lactobacillus bombicola]RHW50551.1 ABC transporter ATP-binding protein [Lactobacillus bombicola]